MHKLNKKEPREPMVLNIPLSEMEALRALHHRTGITRTELVRQGIGLILKQYGNPIEIAPARRTEVPRKDEVKTHRHAGEFLSMSLAELWPNNKIGRNNAKIS